MSNEFYLEQIKKSVTFIFHKKGNEMCPLGTGFFVILNYGELRAIYLVTAKHVICDINGNILTDLHIKLNTKKGTAEYVSLIDNLLTTLFHEDTNVDLAAMIFYLSAEYYDHKMIPENFFLNKAVMVEKNIREGSKAFFAGLFSHFYGKVKIQPVLRFGTISLLTDEKIQIGRTEGPRREAHLFLVECASLRGFSGAPVFFETDRITKDGIFHTPEFYLGGIMKGHYNDVIETKNGLVRELNAGLALITPCYLLREVLYSKKAIEFRRELAEKYLNKS